MINLIDENDNFMGLPYKEEECAFFDDKEDYSQDDCECQWFDITSMMGVIYYVVLIIRKYLSLPYTYQGSA